MKNLLLLLVLITCSINAQSIEGKWKTIDDKTGAAKSIVEIYKQGNQYYGKVVEILIEKNKTKVCEKCKDANKNKPILGLQIINGLKKDVNYYSDGFILDPENGKEYSCKIWIDAENTNVLNVRGYIAFLYRTQKWHRVK